MNGLGGRWSRYIIIEQGDVHGVFVNVNGSGYGRGWRIGRESRDQCGVIMQDRMRNGSRGRDVVNVSS